MPTSHLNTRSAVELRAALTRREITCEQIAIDCINRVTAREDRVRAWAHFDPQHVLSQARQLDRTETRGPLHGIPVGVKDVIDTHDMPTQMGSPIYRDHRPASDASCVALLRAAGALIFGKTVTCEFAGATAAQTTNPHNPERTPGGSSSGSAAAVADFMVPLALGTQTGGSIQRPSSYCGVVGYKSTFGLINTAGSKPAAQSLDTVGLIARTVEDIELAARVLTNAAELQWLSEDTRIRVGLCRTYAWDTAEPDTRDALLKASTRLSDCGHSVKELDLPPQFSELVRTRETVNDFERARAMAHEWNTHRDLISPGLTHSIRRGLQADSSRYIEAQRHLERCRLLLPSVFADVDVLIAPSTTGEAPLGLAFTGDHSFQSIWTQLRVPTVNLPTHASASGMPVGIQLVGPAYADRELLAVARLLFRVLGHGPIIDCDE